MISHIYFPVHTFCTYMYNVCTYVYVCCMHGMCVQYVWYVLCMVCGFAIFYCHSVQSVKTQMVLIIPKYWLYKLDIVNEQAIQSCRQGRQDESEAVCMTSNINSVLPSIHLGQIYTIILHFYLCMYYIWYVQYVLCKVCTVCMWYVRCICIMYDRYVWYV